MKYYQEILINRTKFHSASSASDIPLSQDFQLPSVLFPMILYDGLLKRLAQVHHLQLELKEYQLLYKIALASGLSIDLDTTIQVQMSFQYHMVLHCYNHHIHLGLLVEYIFLDLERFDQTHQDLDQLSCYDDMVKE